MLTSLPRSRPVRRSAKRAERPAAAQAAETATKAPAARARKPAAAAAAKPAAARAKKPAAARAKEPAAAAAKAPGAASAPRRKVPAAGYAAPNTRSDAPPASAGAELISTTIQAAAELAQIGLTVGRQTLQSMLDRLPKP